MNTCRFLFLHLLCVSASQWRQQDKKSGANIHINQVTFCPQSLAQREKGEDHSDCDGRRRRCLRVESNSWLPNWRGHCGPFQSAQIDFHSASGGEVGQLTAANTDADAALPSAALCVCVCVCYSSLRNKPCSLFILFTHPRRMFILSVPSMNHLLNGARLRFSV